MPRLTDQASPRFPNPEVTTDVGKNQRAANQLHSLIKQTIKSNRSALRRAANIIARAPGDRDAILALFSPSEQIELEAFFRKSKALANDLRETDTPALSEATQEDRSDRRARRRARRARREA